ncbi:hypothetical protein Stube_50760 [Streptomyces tubercidicus]|uniref:Uncharacterized protein n=1 Tax=Streptomyces tubercidicus TaxID=47759 RepID=A0A640UWG8_9ACTN|nr:hypothetical protein Stube_50760 [Streptomyces tubercidicus]
MTGQQRQADREPLVGQEFGPGANRLGGAGEAVAHEDADLSAVTAERLGSGKERHRGTPIDEGTWRVTPAYAK